MLRVLPVLVLLLAAGCSSPTAPEQPPAPVTVLPVSLSETAAAIVELTNVERRRAGLPELVAEARLTQAAQLQAEQCARAGTISHDFPNGQYPSVVDRLAAASYPWQAFGENLALGQRSASEVVTAWMDSESHRVNILNDRFTQIGVAVTTDAQGRPYYVQLFGRPRS